jgi:Fe/S biogenesis protein NfuA
MGIISRLFGGEKKGDGREAEPGPDAAPREGVPMGLNQEQPVLTITDTAKEKILGVMAAQEPPIHRLRITAPFRGQYSMNLEFEDNPQLDDTVLTYNGMQVFIDSQSLPNVEGATLDYLETPTGGGFQFSNPNDAASRPERKQAPEGPEGDFWRQVQQVLDEEINPAVAMHGGYISLIDVQGKTLYIEMGGGCQGCGMAKVTLKQGVERVLADHFPEIEEILDVTDHAEGRNPYYAPSTK